MVAALLSELGYLANPVGTHVQSAEMGNQAINSLALISARYTLDALDVLSQISAAHLVALCQALDLRAMHLKFLESLKPLFTNLVQEEFESLLLDDTSSKLDVAQKLLWDAFIKRLDRTTTMDSAPRLTSAVRSLQPILLDHTKTCVETLSAVQSWTQRCSATTIEIYGMNKEQYLSRPDATPFIGAASCSMYRFVRERLSVPFLQEDSIRTPPGELAENEPADIEGKKVNSREYPTIGSLIGVVYQAIRTGALYVVVIDCLKDTMKVEI